MEETDKINIILRQTNYSEVEIREKLTEFGGDEVKVIKNYLGISTANLPTSITRSPNQEIYRQIRHKMDMSIRDFNASQYTKLEQDLS